MNTQSDIGVRPKVIGIAGLYLALAALAYYLTFCNLDGRPFWGDEAETALLARNIVRFGVPRVDDGINHISLHGDGFDARGGLWTWSPWLPDYIAAGSFAVFGQTAWAGRAPFAFIGWLSVPALAFVTWRIYRLHRVALAAMLLLGTSEVFLLHIRQCRYYSITVLAEILLVYGIYKILARNKGGSWFIAGALLVQFYCNYTCAVANIPILVVLGFKLFNQDRPNLLRLLSSFGIFLLLTVPWLLFAETWRQGVAEGRDTRMHLIQFYGWQFQFHFLPWCFVLLPAGGWAVRRFGGGNGNVPLVSKLPNALDSDDSPGSESATQPAWKSALRLRFEKYLFGLMVLYVPVLLVMPMAYSRYLLPLLPIGCLLAAVWLLRYLRWTAIVWVILLVQCLTNWLAVATDPFSRQYPMRSPFADVFFSSLLPYEDRLTDLAKFFRDNARPGDVLLSWDPEFPLAFYTNLKIVDGRLTRDPFNPLPNWILPESATGDLNQKHDLPEVLKARYDKITLNVHDSTQVDTIPEPEVYELETAGNMSPFVIYKLKNEK